MEKRPAGKRLLRETDYALLKRVLCGASSLICLDVDDLTVLQKGGAAFLLESPPCASMDELIRLAPLAAAEMAPEQGRKIVSVLLYCNLPWEADIESLDAICSAIQRTIPEDADIVFGCEFGEECSFLLATSEGKCGSKPFDAAHDRSVMDERYED